MMVCNTLENLVFGLHASGDILKKTIQKLDLFPSSSEGVRDAYPRLVLLHLFIHLRSREITRKHTMQIAVMYV
jgi:hypothetical protein